jgi:hypothetical protein
MPNVKISGLTAAAAVAGANEFEINEAGTSKKVTATQISTFVKADLLDDATVNFTGVLQEAGSNVLAASDIGVSVQGYSANTALLTADQSWSGSQRGTPVTDNDLSFDLNAANNFTCTPSGTGALTFTNQVAGQSGYVLLINTGGHAITAAATTKVGTTFLTTVSTAGTYLISYYSNGTNAYCTTSGVLA